MIIDMHAHLGYKNIYPKSYLRGMMGDEVKSISEKNIETLLSLFLKDKYSEAHIKQMDEAGIEKSVLLIIDGGKGLEEPVMPLEDIYKLHYKTLKLYPERFLVFAGVDPRRGMDGFKLFEKAVVEYGFKGIKLYPPMGYSMDDKRLFDYYQVCSDRKLQVLIHTGDSLPFLQNEFADPENIYSVARQFPKVDFVLAHAGINPIGLVKSGLIKLPNVYVDIAGFQSSYKEVTEQMINLMGPIFSEPYNSKVLFGSDWPMFNMINPLKENIKTLEKLFEKVSCKVPDGLENVLFKNAERVLKLSNN